MHHTEAGFWIHLRLQIELTRSSLKLVQKEQFVHESNITTMLAKDFLTIEINFVFGRRKVYLYLYVYIFSVYMFLQIRMHTGSSLESVVVLEHEAVIGALKCLYHLTKQEQSHHTNYPVLLDLAELVVCDCDNTEIVQTVMPRSLIDSIQSI